jgi:hypothetical protein
MRMGKTYREALLRENNIIFVFRFGHSRRPTLRNDCADITYVQASGVVRRHESENYTFHDSSDEAFGHQFGIRYCYTAKPDIDERFAIGARLRNEIQKIPRRRPVEFWIIQEPANRIRMRLS